MTKIKATEAPRNGRAFLIVFLALLSAFGPFVTDFYLPTLPEQTADFGAPASLVQLGLSATMWGLAAGQLWIGPLSDVRGRRVPLAASLAVFSLATAGAVFAPDIETFIAMRFLEGLGASGAVVMSRSIAADLCTGRELASLMAVVGGIQGIAPVTAPMIGALIAEAAGWREIFMLLLAIGVALTAVTIFVFRESLAKAAARPKGSVAASFAVLMKDPLFAAMAAQQFFASGILFGHISASPFVFQTSFGLSPSAYGLVFGLLALSITAGAMTSSRFASPAAAMEKGAFGTLLGSILAAAAFWTHLPVWAVIGALVVLLASLGLTLPSAMTFALTLHRERAGAAAAILGSIAFLGGGLVAPLTALADPRLCVSVIFLASSLTLVVIALITRRALAQARARHAGETISFADDASNKL